MHAMIAGFYEDDLERVEGEWLIARQIQIKTDREILTGQRGPEEAQ